MQCGFRLFGNILEIADENMDSEDDDDNDDIDLPDNVSDNNDNDQVPDRNSELHVLQYDENNENIDDFIDELDVDLMFVTGEELLGSNTIFMAGDIIKYPSELSQSTLNGRNGSSACTTIALFTGKFITPLISRTINSSIINTFIGCMEYGNMFYNGETDGFHVFECLKSLPFMLNVIEDHGGLLNELNERLLSVSDEYFVVVTVNGKSYCCIPYEDCLFFFDSHFHVTYGASITKINKVHTAINSYFQDMNDMKDKNVLSEQFDFYILSIS